MAINDVYFDENTGELVFEQGFAEKRFKLCELMAACAPGDTVPFDPEIDIPELPDIEGTENPIEPQYTSCAMATELIDRIEAIGRAAWDHRTDPWSIKSAIRDANPGYDVAMANCTSLWIITSGLSAIEAFGDANLFNPDFLSDWKCWIKSHLAVGEGITSDVMHQLVGHYPMGYALFTEVPDLSAVVDVWASKFWVHIYMAILGKNRVNQIMLESIGKIADCSDCGGVGVNPLVPTDYDWRIIADFTVDEAGFVAISDSSYLAGEGWRGTDNWWHNGSAFGIKTPMKEGAGTGAVLYWKYVVEDVEPTIGNTYDTGAGFTINANGTTQLDVTLSQRSTIISAGGGTHESAGYWPYSASADGNLAVIFEVANEYNLGNRIIMKRIELYGTGDPPSNIAELFL